MTKKREHDPELEGLLRAFREVHPSAAEKNRWNAAIADEIRELNTPVEPPARIGGGNVRRFLLRAAIPVTAAASLGFVIGAYFVEKRYDAGQAMLFSQVEPIGLKVRPPTTMDEEREVVRINLDSGVDR